MSVYTPASCRTASDHGRDRYRTAGTALERYTSGSADRTSASAALLDRRLHLWLVAQACERNLKFVTQDKMNKIGQVVGADIEIILWQDK